MKQKILNLTRRITQQWRAKKVTELEMELKVYNQEQSIIIGDKEIFAYIC